jgi:hypothetical protein
MMNVLLAFGRLNPDYAHPPPNSGVSLPADWFLGKISIGSDEGVLYKKMESSAPATNELDESSILR